MNNLLNFQNISKVYPGVRALNSVDFALAEGEIHCLVGENGSGKSTFIKIVSGVVQPEPGAQMEISGQALLGGQASIALDRGVRVIYQDLALFPNLTVKENIAFALYKNSKGIFVNWKEIEVQARQAMETINLQVDPDKLVSSLSIAEQQQVEIVRSIMGDIKLLILDEPTASLTRVEVDRLFATIKTLKEKNIATLFVSHKLSEIFEIAERISVFRDGHKVGVYDPAKLDQKKLIYLMTGQGMDSKPPQDFSSDAPTILQVDSLSREGNYRDISFSLKAGEILGITGRLGSGRTELALSLFGMASPDSGQIFLEGKQVFFTTNEEALKAGIAYVPEDRLSQGLIMPQSIFSNLTVTMLKKFLGFLGLIDKGKSRPLANDWVERLDIRISNMDAAVETLSGGNQQKVVLSKWLATEPKVLILDEPTVGIDVLAKNSVHRFVKQLAHEGMGIILISDEVHEVIHNSHRVLVMDQGRIVDDLLPTDEDTEKILLERFNLA